VTSHTPSRRFGAVLDGSVREAKLVGAENVIRPSGEGRCISRPVVSHRRRTVAHLVRPRVGSSIYAARTSRLIAKIEVTNSIVRPIHPVHRAGWGFRHPQASVITLSVAVPANSEGFAYSSLALVLAGTIALLVGCIFAAASIMTSDDAIDYEVKRSLTLGS